ncbi:aminotransferase class V-fold PLP-dependent enzyme [Novosphingobium sp. G106]|uniref:cysteine desulfurase family protein n=1 Tax=Novosphingobium sp. G106 TaxID=2849500 RepID=UPI001C2DDA05|nr:aminotransferase class V-fold PLP-dependent enzyme [Novosphingobium sp. G106]MBV1686366.1 aminotransferase class V-fold PLP-dependent enzyme [Novosphingobium sp. G106]
MDNMAATPIDPRVTEHHGAAMTRLVANAHSVEHKAGAEARAALDDAAAAVLRSLGSEVESVTFTPGASAALWLAVEDAIARAFPRQARIAASVVEHPALLSALRRAKQDGRIHLELLPVNDTATPRLDAVEAALTSSVDLLCTMAVNNEVGTISDVRAMGALAARHGTRHLVDASQAAGRIEMGDIVAADLVVVSGAKVYGPRRVGALIGTISRQASELAHDLFGSPDAPAASALAFALDLREGERGRDEARIATLRDRIQVRLLELVPELRINCMQAARISGCLHVSTPHLPGEAAVSRLWARVAVSTGAACQSGVPGPSHVMTAMEIPEWAREGAVRIGVGRFNTDDEIDEASEIIAAALAPSEPARRRA